jgi:hypothetical protein
MIALMFTARLHYFRSKEHHVNTWCLARCGLLDEHFAHKLRTMVCKLVITKRNILVKLQHQSARQTSHNGVIGFDLEMNIVSVFERVTAH